MFSGSVKMFVKNIQRVNKAFFRKMNLFRMFTVDASLPGALIRLVITYVIVLLQFAFR